MHERIDGVQKQLACIQAGDSLGVLGLREFRQMLFGMYDEVLNYCDRFKFGKSGDYHLVSIRDGVRVVEPNNVGVQTRVREIPGGLVSMEIDEDSDIAVVTFSQRSGLAGINEIIFMAPVDNLQDLRAVIALSMSIPTDINLDVIHNKIIMDVSSGKIEVVDGTSLKDSSTN